MTRVAWIVKTCHENREATYCEDHEDACREDYEDTCHEDRDSR